MLAAVVMIAATTSSPIAPSALAPAPPLLKFICTGTQVSSRSDIAGTRQLPWKRTFRINQKSMSVCTEVCRGTRAELSAQKVVMHAPDDGRLSSPLTLDRASMKISGQQVIPLSATVKITLDTTGQCVPAA